MKTSSEKEIAKFKSVGARNRKQGDDYEAYLESRLRLKRQRGSGSGTIEKEDHVGQDPRGEYIMVQAKSFSGKTITIKIEDLERLVQHAADSKVFDGRESLLIQYGREPIFVVGVVNQIFNGPKDWVMVPLEAWEKYGKSKR